MDEHQHSERLMRIETKMESVLEKLEEVVSRAEFWPDHCRTAYEADVARAFDLVKESA